MGGIIGAIGVTVLLAGLALLRQSKDRKKSRIYWLLLYVCAAFLIIIGAYLDHVR
jgi:hypothetical membrane protein